MTEDSEIAAIDVEDRLRRVYAAARRPTWRQRLTSKITGSRWLSPRPRASRGHGLARRMRGRVPASRRWR